MNLTFLVFLVTSSVQVYSIENLNYNKAYGELNSSAYSSQFNSDVEQLYLGGFSGVFIDVEEEEIASKKSISYASFNGILPTISLNDLYQKNGNSKYNERPILAEIFYLKYCSLKIPLH